MEKPATGSIGERNVALIRGITTGVAPVIRSFVLSEIARALAPLKALETATRGLQQAEIDEIVKFIIKRSRPHE